MSQRERDNAGRRRSATLPRAGLLAGGAVGAFALAAPVAQAANFQVNSLLDLSPNACDATCTLRDAITLANATNEPDTITFDSSLSGTLRLSQGTALVTSGLHNLTIDGPGRQVVVSGDADNDGNPDSRIFKTGDDGTNDSGDLSIEGLTLTTGTTASYGGAVYGFASGAEITLTNVTVTNSVALNGGGGIYTDEPLTLINSTVSDNETAGLGGGIYSGDDLIVRGSTVSGNIGNEGGAGISHSGKYAPSEISNSRIIGNTAVGAGGGILLRGAGGRQDIAESTISGNGAGRGAGIQLEGISGDARVKILRSTISDNDGYPGSSGGGIGAKYVQGDIAVVNSTVSGNSAARGGGVSLGDGASSELLSDTGSFEFESSTIAGNSATGPGGGIYLGMYPGDSGNTSATIPLTSTIVADNRAQGAAQDLDRANGSGGGGFDTAFSLIERKGDAPVFTSGPNLLGVDPKLGPLAANGGPTRTHRPAASSKVIDRGDSLRLATDQRTRRRVVNLAIPNPPGGNGTDIGAVELRASELPNRGKCAGRAATIFAGRTAKGTAGPDVIVGSPGKNVIRGRGGGDRICGLAGNDRLLGGAGPDRLFGGPGQDLLLGGPGRDLLRGGPGRDRERQ